MRLPKALLGHKLFMLRRWANLVGGHYCCPIYLVGSALRKNAPRDYDARMRMPDDDFKIRYGCDDANQWVLRQRSGLWDRSNWAWAHDCVRRTKFGWRFCKLNLDFQIVPECDWQTHRGKPRFRIDGHLFLKAKT